MDSWYLQNKKDYNEFIRLHPAEFSFDDHRKEIKAMFNWCESNNITFTPTFFINGYQLPEVYDIEDLSYFLLG